MTNSSLHFCHPARRSLIPVAVFAGWLFCVSSAADPVFKSVDSKGTVSYGDKPASGAAIVRQISIETAPSTAQVEQARATTERIKSMANELEQERLAREAVIDKQRKALEMEQQFQAELDAEIRQVELTAEAQRLARQKQEDRNKPKRPKPKPKGPPTTSDKAINMRPNVPLLNLPGPPE